MSNGFFLMLEIPALLHLSLSASRALTTPKCVFSCQSGGSCFSLSSHGPHICMMHGFLPYYPMLPFSAYTSLFACSKKRGGVKIDSQGREQKKILLFYIQSTIIQKKKKNIHRYTINLWYEISWGWESLGKNVYKFSLKGGETLLKYTHQHGDQHKHFPFLWFSGFHSKSSRPRVG